MKFKIFIDKLIYLFKQNKNEILLSIIISGILSCFFIFAVIPYGGYLDIGDIRNLATIFDKINYSFFVIPFIIWYIIVIFDSLKKIKFLRTLIYPVILLTLWLCIFMCVTIFDYENIHILLYLFSSWYILPVMFVITEIYAIIQDIKTFKNTTLPKE